MSKYIVKQGQTYDEFFVIEVHNGRGVKKFGPFPKWKAVAIANKYLEQDKAAIEARKGQLTAHHNLPKGEDLSQADAVEMISQLRKRLKSD